MSQLRKLLTLSVAGGGALIACAIMYSRLHIMNRRIPAPTADVRVPATSPVLADKEVDLVDLRSEEMARIARIGEETLVAPEITQRISKQIQELKGESLQQSLEELSHVDSFYWPGPPAAGGVPFASMIPLPESFGQEDLDAIASNRRFLKVYAELSALPRQAAASLLIPQIERSVPEYKRLYEEHVAKFRPSYERERLKDAPVIVGVPFVIENAPDGGVVLAGARLKLLSLVWLCGLLDLDAAAPQVQAVIRLAVDQRNAMYGDAGVVDTFKQNMLCQGSVYNRQILVSAALGTGKRTSHARDLLQELGLSLQQRRLTSFDARFTCSDLPVRSGFALPDYSNGQIIIRCLGPVSDSAFDAAIARCR